MIGRAQGKQGSDRWRKIHSPPLEIVTRAGNSEEFDPRADRRDSLLQFGERAEGIGASMDEDSREAHARKMLGAQLARLPRRVQRIREQEKRVRDGGIFGREHRRLAPAIGVAAEEDRSAHNVPHRRDSSAQTIPIRRTTAPRRRAGLPPLPERQVDAKRGDACVAERRRRREKQRGLAISAGAMRQHETSSARARSGMQKASNPFGGEPSSSTIHLSRLHGSTMISDLDPTRRAARKAAMAPERG
jgi:hypothetical protein